MRTEIAQLRPARGTTFLLLWCAVLVGFLVSCSPPPSSTPPQSTVSQSNLRSQVERSTNVESKKPSPPRLNFRVLDEDTVPTHTASKEKIKKPDTPITAVPTLPAPSPEPEIIATPGMSSPQPQEPEAPASTPVEVIAESLVAPTEESTLEPSPEPTIQVTVPIPTATALAQIPLTGSMTIDFSSRVPGSKSSEDASDMYHVQLLLADSLPIQGSIERKPRVLSRIFKSEKQPLELIYKLQFGNSAANVLATLTGSLITNASGHYEFSSSQPGSHPLRIDAGVPSSIGGSFGGYIQGKQEESEVSDSVWKRYTRWIAGRKVTIHAKRTDPLSFNRLVLASGPFPAYPSVTVSGNLDYDYDTGNWLTDGITMKYSLEGQSHTDTITGSIKWVEDPHRSINGKGTYECNLRFNEQAIAGTPDEGTFFEEELDEAAFFSDTSDVPYLGGRILYEDSFLSNEEEEPTVIKSRIHYALQGHGLTKTQVMNFLKLWLLIVGPVNDE